RRPAPRIAPQDSSFLPVAAPSDVRGRPAGRLGHAADELRPLAVGPGSYGVRPDCDTVRGARPAAQVRASLRRLARGPLIEAVNLNARHRHRLYCRLYASLRLYGASPPGRP